MFNALKDIQNCICNMEWILPDIGSASKGIILWTLVAVVLVWPFSEARAARMTVPLSQLSPASTADLRGAKASFGLKIPVPERWSISSSTLEASVVSSVALLPERSLMTVRLNGHPLKQVRLGTASGRHRFSVELPPALLEPGYNDLEFVAMQRSTQACQDRGDPELWSTLELNRSAVSLNYELRPVPAALSSLPTMVFDPKIMGQGRVHIVLEDFSPQSLKEASLAAAGAALRYDYRPVHFSVSTNLVKGVDTIAIGSQEFLQGTLLQSLVPIEGSLSVMHLPKVRTAVDNGTERREVVFDQTHVLIAIQGQGHEDRIRAARALSVMNRPWPGGSSLDVDGVSLPAISWSSGRKTVKPGMVTTARELGLKTTTFQGMEPEPAEMSFRLPSQVAVHESRFFTLSLDLVYGAQMRQDSALNVVVNEEFAAAIPLADQQGARYEDYKLQLPVALLKPGRNSISFEPVLTPLITGECTLIQEGNLRMTLEGDSTLELPEMSRWVVMPDLGLLFQDGFPLTASPDWTETAVVLPEATPESVSAALDLIGLISQKNGISPDGITFAPDLQQAGDRHVLALGRKGRLPGELLQAAQLETTLSYPFPLQAAEASWKETSWWRNGLLKLFGRQPVREPDVMQDPPESSQVQAKPSLSPESVLVSEFASPTEDDRTVVLITGQSVADVQRGVRALLDPGVSSKVNHDTALIDFHQDRARVFTHQTQDAYSYGRQSPVPLFQDLILDSLWMFVLVSVLVIVILALILTLLLRRRRSRRLSHGE